MWLFNTSIRDTTGSLMYGVGMVFGCGVEFGGRWVSDELFIVSGGGVGSDDSSY